VEVGGGAGAGRQHVQQAGKIEHCGGLLSAAAKSVKA
jgi:hypothetical protein